MIGGVYSIKWLNLDMFFFSNFSESWFWEDIHSPGCYWLSGKWIFPVVLLWSGPLLSFDGGFEVRIKLGEFSSDTVSFRILIAQQIFRLIVL